MDDSLKYRGTSQNLRSLLPAIIFLKPYKLHITCALLAILFTSSLSLSFGEALKRLIDGGYLSSTPEMLSKGIFIFMSVMTLICLGSFVRFRLVLGLGERLSADIRQAVFNHVIDLNPGFFDDNLSGEIQTRITTDTSIIQSVISASVSMTLRSLIILIGGIVMMLFSNIKLSLVVFSLILLVIFPLRYFGNKVRNYSRISQDNIALAGAYIGETLQHIKTVHAFNHQNLDKDIFKKDIENTYQAGIVHVKMRAFMISSIIMLVAVAMSCMFWVGGNDVMANKITFGELAAFTFYATAMGLAVSTLSEVAGDLLRAAGAMERLMELLSSTNALEPTHKTLHKDTLQVEGNIAIENLYFAYPKRPNKNALNDVNLTIKAGETIALVGPSGAGKSTLFDLVMRFYDPQQGNITIDDIDISGIKLEDLRSKLSIVQQNPSIFSSDILSNIRYGKVNASLDEVKQAAKTAYADEFIERLPEGYNTFVGEAGVQLSGGQRQRLAIARSILQNPSILLLDEATSALDAKSEQIVQLALEGLMQNRTTLVIAHRLSTVINADRIAVLQEGRIIEVGTHEELLKSSPLYSQLADLQFNH